MAAGMAAKRVETDWLLRPAAGLVPLDESRAKLELSEIADAARG